MTKYIIHMYNNTLIVVIIFKYRIVLQRYGHRIFSGNNLILGYVDVKPKNEVSIYFIFTLIHKTKQATYHE